MQNLSELMNRLIASQVEFVLVDGFDEVLKHSIEVELPYGKCRILDIDTLIRAKEVMNRDHDRITVRHLQEIKKQQKAN